MHYVASDIDWTATTARNAAQSTRNAARATRHRHTRCGRAKHRRAYGTRLNLPMAVALDQPPRYRLSADDTLALTPGGKRLIPPRVRRSYP